MESSQSPVPSLNQREWQCLQVTLSFEDSIKSGFLVRHLLMGFQRRTSNEDWGRHLLFSAKAEHVVYVRTPIVLRSNTITPVLAYSHIWQSFNRLVGNFFFLKKKGLKTHCRLPDKVRK